MLPGASRVLLRLRLVHQLRGAPKESGILNSRSFVQVAGDAKRILSCSRPGDQFRGYSLNVAGLGSLLTSQTANHEKPKPKQAWHIPGVIAGLIFGTGVLAAWYEPYRSLKKVDNTLQQGSRVPPISVKDKYIPRPVLEKQITEVLRPAMPIVTQYGIIECNPGVGTTTAIRHALQDLKEQGMAAGIIYVNLHSTEDFWEELARAINYDGAELSFLSYQRDPLASLAASYQQWKEEKIRAAYETACVRFRQRNGREPTLVIDAVSQRDIDCDTRRTAQLLRRFERWTNDGLTHVKLVFSGQVPNPLQIDWAGFRDLMLASKALVMPEASETDVAAFLQPPLTKEEASFAAQHLGGNFSTICKAKDNLAPYAGSPDFQTRLLEFVLNEGAQRCAKVGALWDVDRPNEARVSRYLKPNQEASILTELAGKMEQQHGHYLTWSGVTNVLMLRQPHSLKYEQLIQSNILSERVSGIYVQVCFAEGILESFFRLLRNE